MKLNLDGKNRCEELAIIVVRGRENSVLCYPAVETMHRDNISHIVKAPVDESQMVMKLAAHISSRSFYSWEGVGVFAFEINLTGDGEMAFYTPGDTIHSFV